MIQFPKLSHLPLTWFALNGSNYPCFEQITMVPKLPKPLKFDCVLYENGDFSQITVCINMSTYITVPTYGFTSLLYEGSIEIHV